MEKTLAIDGNQKYQKMLETLREYLTKFGCYLDKRHAQGGATWTRPKKMRFTFVKA